MNKLVSAINEALAEQGLSDAAASDLAVGHKQLLKNIRNRKSAERMHPIDAIARLFDVLDIEVQLKSGSNSMLSADLRGFAEDQLLVEGRPEALAEGYAPIPYLREAGGVLNISPVAVSRDWATSMGLNFDELVVVKVLPGAETHGYLAGDRLIVDQRPEPELDGRTFAFFTTLMGGAEFGSLSLGPSRRPVVVRQLANRIEHVPLPNGHRIIGPVVGMVRWTTQGDD